MKRSDPGLSHLPIEPDTLERVSKGYARSERFMKPGLLPGSTLGNRDYRTF
jgi:hypothetical protein